MKKFILLAAIAVSLNAATVMAQEINDPIEPVNRAVFKFNTVVDTYALDPAIVAYRAAVPKPIRTGVKNFINHLENPIILANNVLQGDVTGAFTTIKRSVINTFVGFGGVWDVAAQEGIVADPEDFGQTLAVWGLDSGPYLVLPLLGPSNPRDLGGMIVDSYADPLNRYADNIDEKDISTARTATKVLVTKDKFYDAQKDLKANSSDYYAAVRSAATQARKAAITDSGKGSGTTALPDFE